MMPVTEKKDVCHRIYFAYNVSLTSVTDGPSPASM